ncbi:MAG: hypothetical protein B7Z15_21140 [Rhizobiales bacterium 32-66-8]|nr:MAG: hypothetical protein B7Z15_21140 [Rhizobiales bacterium 32-66-8]
MARDEIERALGVTVELADKDAAIAAPGMLASHYAPNALLRLAAEPQEGEAFLAFGAVPDFSGPTRNLSPAGDLHEAARNLFAMLHELDAAGRATIAVAPIPDTGLGEAINDRLQRAAAPRGR